MNKTKNRLFIDYFLSPEEIEDIKNEGIKPKFVLSSSESSEKISGLLKRYAGIQARFSAQNENAVEKRFNHFLNYFSRSSFENEVMKINKQIFDKYNANSRRVEIDPPLNLEGIELIVLKKALNKKGWLVQQTNYACGKFNYGIKWKYVFAPRKKELKTELNCGVKNMELAFDRQFNECYFDSPIAGFYRNHKTQK